MTEEEFFTIVIIILCIILALFAYTQYKRYSKAIDGM
jgi:uncharacterized membrane protein YidH (DUF202 family)